MTQILGIVNLTADSFSDGGRFLEPQTAIAHARQLLADGADILDLGAESTHPRAQRVSADVEIARLTPVVEALKADGARLSIDTCKFEVMRRMLELGVEFINDVTGLADPRSRAVLRGSSARIIVMHSIREVRADVDDGRASARSMVAPEEIVAHSLQFFHDRLEILASDGIKRERLILDPGMGFFVGDSPAASLNLLRNIEEFRGLRCPLLISTSRKSFLGAILESAGTPRPIGERGAGTLAAELWAASQGVEYIRTHDVRALRDGLRVWAAIQSAERFVNNVTPGAMPRG